MTVPLTIGPQSTTCRLQYPERSSWVCLFLFVLLLLVLLDLELVPCIPVSYWVKETDTLRIGYLLPTHMHAFSFSMWASNNGDKKIEWMH